MVRNVIGRLRLHGAAERFAHATSASTSMIFGLAAIPTFGLLAFAIDYGSALHAKAKLDAAADAASMTAITTAKNVISNASSSGSSVTSTAIAEGKTQALAAFKANAGNVAYTGLPTPDIQITRVNQTLTATVRYSTRISSNLITMMGIKQMNLNGLSTSTLTMPTYINYYILVDTSQSMGVGSTPQDMQNLYNRVIKYANYDTQANANAKIGCVFGCHVQQSANGYTQPDSNENLAHNTLKYGTPFINLRIDAAKSAIQTILSDASTANQQSQMSLIQIGIYSMQADPTQSGTYIQNVVDPPSSNFTLMGATGGPVDKMDLGNNTGAGIGDTDFTNSLNTFAQKLQTQGDGSAASSALNYVFIITDGIFDTPSSSCTYGHCTGPLDDSLCTQLKAKASVGVIYTTYNPVYTQNDPTQGYQDAYVKLVYPSANLIAPNLQACSSGSQFYFEATDGPSITTGMQKLFAPTLQAARLSQ